ncbi:MAG TPA: hypothetical protein VFE58_12820 [Tepidisphaeraceae bacterium]|jgi:hypothetical protein|nr:hypothetical protein [Tepidisphaeraceae bacterium]
MSTHRYSLSSRHLLLSAVALVALPIVSVRADIVELDGGYHAQVTNFFCAAASAEMALDVPAVRNANPVVDGMLSVGDGPTVPANSPLPLATLQIQGGIGVVTGGAQAFIYGLNHGLNTVNGVGYFNPFSPPGTGTDSQGLDVGLNLLDNPNVNGAANPALPFGSHSYAGYNLLNQGLASRTIANALSQYSVPAVAAVNNGAHAISVYGVETDGAIGPGLNYTIKGFYVHDPWTGWAVTQQNAGNFDPALVRANGGLGLGYNTYLRYGFDQDPANAPATQLPNGNSAAVTLAPWTRIFSPAGGQITPNLAWTDPGYKFEVEPQGPEVIDTGDSNNDFGFPAPPSNLASAIASGVAADTAALADLAADGQLAADLEIAGGHFDVADAMFMQTPDESGAEGDWLIPYDTAGGTISGGILIDSETGVIDEATWIDPADPNQVPYSLSQLDTLFLDQEAGDLPIDNVLPEPALTCLALLTLPLLRRRRQMKS